MVEQQGEPDQVVGELGIPGISGAVQIGRGGFGVVYRAHQERFGRDVAVKILHGVDLSDKARLRFDREKLALGSVSGHPNIVTLYDAGLTVYDVPYLVMELLTGGTLHHRLSVTGPFPIDQVFEIGIKLAGALETAHRAGVLHLDVKPENVLLSSFGEPHLADFGIARFAGHGTRSAMITASIGHAAPEILSEDDPTPAADVYSLASMLYALAAGKAPHAGESDRMLSAMITRILTVPAQPVAGVPDALNEVLLRSLEKQPAARHGSANELGQALHDAARSLGIAALPVPVAHASSESQTTTRERPGSPAPRVPPPLGTMRIDPSQRAAPLPDQPEKVDPAPKPTRSRTLKVAAIAAAAVVGLGASAFALTNNDAGSNAAEAATRNAPSSSLPEIESAESTITNPAAEETPAATADSELIRALWDGYSQSWEQGTDAAFAFLAANNYPGMGCSADEFRTAWSITDDSYYERVVVDETTNELDPAWKIPVGPLAGQVPSGRIWVSDFDFYYPDSSEPSPASVHTAIRDERAYFFFSCEPPEAARLKVPEYPEVVVDDFSSDSGYWRTGVMDTTLADIQMSIESEGYIWRIRDSTDMTWWTFLNEEVGSTYFVEVLGKRLSGVADYGLIFGYKSNDDFWIYSLDDSGRVTVSQRSGGAWQPALLDEEPEVISPSDRHRLSIRVEQSELSFYVNGREIGRLSAGGQRLSGAVGLSAYVPTDESAVVRFDNFKLLAP